MDGFEIKRAGDRDCRVKIKVMPGVKD